MYKGWILIDSMDELHIVESIGFEVRAVEVNGDGTVTVNVKGNQDAVNWIQPCWGLWYWEFIKMEGVT